MKDFKFYAEMPEDRRSKSASIKFDAFTRDNLRTLASRGLHNNVIAVPLDDAGRPLWIGDTTSMDAFVTQVDRSNSPVAGGVVQQEYLRKRCVLIRESLARQLHPNLFFHLEK